MWTKGLLRKISNFQTIFWPQCGHSDICLASERLLVRLEPTDTNPLWACFRKGIRHENQTCGGTHCDRGGADSCFILTVVQVNYIFCCFFLVHIFNGYFTGNITQCDIISVCDVVAPMQFCFPSILWPQILLGAFQKLYWVFYYENWSDSLTSCSCCPYLVCAVWCKKINKKIWYYLNKKRPEDSIWVTSEMRHGQVWGIQVYVLPRCHSLLRSGRPSKVTLRSGRAMLRETAKKEGKKQTTGLC